MCRILIRMQSKHVERTGTVLHRCLYKTGQWLYNERNGCSRICSKLQSSSNILLLLREFDDNKARKLRKISCDAYLITRHLCRFYLTSNCDLKNRIYQSMGAYDTLHMLIYHNLKLATTSTFTVIDKRFSSLLPRMDPPGGFELASHILHVSLWEPRCF